MSAPTVPSVAGAATFKTWATGKTWHVHARHPVTKSWIRASGLYSEVEAMLRGDQFCDTLDAESLS